MSVFDGKRLTNSTFKLDLERMRRGWYSDKYFENIGGMLAALAAQGYRYAGRQPHLAVDVRCADVGNMEVEMQWFTRRPGKTVVAGVDKALAMLRHSAGCFEGDQFIETWDQLEVEAVHDGAVVTYSGDPLHVHPVLRVRGRYRDFALLETPTLGALTRGSRVATNVYNTLIAARGKPVFFFPARFDLHEVQAADGYAYYIGVQRFKKDFALTPYRSPSGRGELAPSSPVTRHSSPPPGLDPLVSTDAQGDWWGGAGGGTVAHAAIASFFGDTAEAMLAFAATRPPHIPRIALVDFNHDSVGDSLSTLRRMFECYRQKLEAGEAAEARNYILAGVRLDTAGSVRDVNVPPLGDPALDLGVNPRLAFIVRQALDEAWRSWDVPPGWHERAANYCRNVKIVVSGGFNVEKIARFERLGVPVDAYGVGSSLFSNDGPTNTDFTADVVRVKVNGEWVENAKVGRRAGENPELEEVR